MVATHSYLVGETPQMTVVVKHDLSIGVSVPH